MNRVFKMLKPFLVILVLAVTVGTFVLYVIHHPELRSQIRHTSPGLLISLLLLYLAATLTIGLILMATLMLCRVKLGWRESTLLTMYSSIINFFGPLQSGPAARAVYLKSKHGLKLKDYTLATLAYYAFYGGFSLLFLLSAVFGWWLLPCIVAGLVCVYLLYRSDIRLAQRFRTLNLRALGFLGAATLLQVLIISLIYYLELHSLTPHIRPSQAIVYTGAANLALFVSITPGAIGFRESFLVFSQHLHHVSNATIVSANIIDRSVYIVLLLGLAVIIFGLHAQNRFLAKTEAADQQASTKPEK